MQATISTRIEILREGLPDAAPDSTVALRRFVRV
jgi:hypothetical protein